MSLEHSEKWPRTKSRMTSLSGQLFFQLIGWRLDNASLCSLAITSKEMNKSSCSYFADNHFHKKRCECLLDVSISEEHSNWRQHHIDLSSAIQQGHLLVPRVLCSPLLVRYLLSDSRIDPCHDLSAAFVCTLVVGCSEVVKILLADERIDPFAQTTSILELAGDPDVLRVLRADPRFQ